MRHAGLEGNSKPLSSNHLTSRVERIFVPGSTSSASTVGKPSKSSCQEFLNRRNWLPSKLQTRSSSEATANQTCKSLAPKKRREKSASGMSSNEFSALSSAVEGAKSISSEISLRMKS
eukprot:Amastigsp_a515809_32.p4 type:complete len:118 gc:universal Amastigsp_a515809_32:666-313(-)